MQRIREEARVILVTGATGNVGKPLVGLLFGARPRRRCSPSLSKQGYLAEYTWTGDHDE